MIGKDNDGNDIGIDAGKLIGKHLAVIGNTGSGKSYTVRKVLEETWGAAGHIVFDPEREFHTLRQVYPYLIVDGPNGDMMKGDPAVLARFLLESGRSAIVQFDDDEHLEAQQEFIGLFLDALMMMPRELWKPTFLVIDEAHRYAPQDENVVSRRPIHTLMSQGRKRGFTGILCTQRLAKISKSAVGECNTWLVGRVGQVLDRNAAANNLGFPLRSPEALALRTLNAGQFWGFGLALSKLPVLISIGATRSQHLTLGQSWSPTPIEGLELPTPHLAIGLPNGLGAAMPFILVVAVIALSRFVFF
ncbi:DUF87 domain-containing protein [Methylobacterium sp. WL103]|uniref:ATP-binding protein n=1 Tax=Methylobacterium sp. WL103 TaxID=2603891 RepID=UPI0011C87659|nr:DUF87 domain-containing protein [Methylobacterium sp. WL103]TXN08937.1 DUF87 domain-containing protein [Methylobacterium sp. WL103]